MFTRLVELMYSACLDTILLLSLARCLAGEGLPDDDVQYFNAMEKGLDATNPYELGSFGPLAPLKVKEPFCSFFDNRRPQSQPDLQNCTWYRERSCCRQAELGSIFKKVKPLQGASDNCMRHLNYMICWVCDPLQYNFYLNGWRRLKMCESFCDEVLDACKYAKLKGEYVGDLYRNGTEFCKSRRFDVKTGLDDKSCFSYSVKKSRSDPWRNLRFNASNRSTPICTAVLVGLFMSLMSILSI